MEEFNFLAEIVKTIPPMSPEHSGKVVKRLDDLISQAREEDKRRIEDLMEALKLIRSMETPSDSETYEDNYTRKTLPVTAYRLAKKNAALIADEALKKIEGERKS